MYVSSLTRIIYHEVPVVEKLRQDKVVEASAFVRSGDPPHMQFLIFMLSVRTSIIPQGQLGVPDFTLSEGMLGTPHQLSWCLNDLKYTPRGHVNQCFIL